MRQKRPFLNMIALLLLLVMPSCSQDEKAGLITAGAEASTVAAMLTVKQELPDEAVSISIALSRACQQANELLRDTKSATTLREVLDLSFSKDPLLTRIKPVIDFCLPVLETVSGVTEALDRPISGLNGTVNAYAQAFFNGVSAGLALPTGTTVEALREKDPKVDRALRLAARRFDPDALAGKLKALKAKK